VYGYGASYLPVPRTTPLSPTELAEKRREEIAWMAYYGQLSRKEAEARWQEANPGMVRPPKPPPGTETGFSWFFAGLSWPWQGKMTEAKQRSAPYVYIGLAFVGLVALGAGIAVLRWLR
jgi:hypothetical protein